MAYQKTGYQDLLEFDPERGVVKYGAYEMFADALGIKPQESKITFDQWKASKVGGDGSIVGKTYANSLTMKDFIADIQANGITQPTKSAFNVPATPTAGLFNIVNDEEAAAGSLKVKSYQVPQTIELVNKIGEAAQGLKRNPDDVALKNEQALNSAQRKMGAGSTQLLKATPQANVASRSLLSS